MRAVHTADVPRIRAAVRSQLQRLAIAHTDIDLVTLLLTELMGNAMRHGLVPVICQINVKSLQIRVEVCDHSSDAPVVVESPPDAVGGRGMKLVSSLATQWGWHATDVGKCVWFEIATCEQQCEPVPA